MTDLDAIRDEWYAVGTSTEPADRATAEAAVTGLYALIGQAAPVVLWADSPLAAAKAVPAELAGAAEAFGWAWDQPDDELCMFEISVR